MTRIAILLLAALTAACGGGTEQANQQPPTTSSAQPIIHPPPSLAEAKAIIDESGTLGEFEFTKAAVTVPMQKSAMNEPQLAAAEQLVKAGWIAFDGSGAVVLAKAQDDKRFLVRPNGFLDVVPVAKKEMGDVTAIRPLTAGEAEAEFTYRWVPTEVGTAFTSGPVFDLFAQPVRAKATLFWDGSTWSVMRVATM